MNKKISSRYSLIFLYFLIPVFGFLPERRTVESQKNIQQSGFVSYLDTIPGTTVSFEMISIPGGKFMMGSTEMEKGHRQDESPQHTVEVDSFWMGKTEITWDEYELFVFPELEKQADKTKEFGVDAVSKPTPPYVDMSFGMGKRGFPAVNMTQYAALMYCKWLTAKTGDFYRLPTEAEWEYACRAGSSTAYSYGDDESQLENYAWYKKNSKNKYQRVATKKPNSWGLYDMHGNVTEWTMDQYIPDYYTSLKDQTTKNPWAVPTYLYPRVTKGGSWKNDAIDLRCASRIGSDPDWKQRDPQSPKSDWWNTDASFAGFRILRPVKKPSPEEIEKYFAQQPKDY